MRVEARLEGIRKEPLNEGVVSLQSLVVTLPLGMHSGDEDAIGSGGGFVQVEIDVKAFISLLLLSLGRRALVDRCDCRERR